VLKQLSKEQIARPGSAAEVTDALQTCLNGLASENNSRSTAPENTASIRPWTIVAISLAAALAVWWLAGALWNSAPVADSTNHAENDPSTSDPPAVPRQTRAATDADFMPDVWNKLLLDEPPPIFMLDSAKHDFSPGQFTLKTDSPALLKLGDTQASSYSLRITLKPDAWEGNSGIVIGFGPSAMNPDLDQCLLIGVREVEAGRISVERRMMQQQRTGLQLPASFVQFLPSSDHVSRPASGEAILQVDVKDQHVTATFLENTPIQFPSGPLALKSGSKLTAFGIYVLDGSSTFSNAAIRLTP
jgi:hypothetical protein